MVYLFKLMLLIYMAILYGIQGEIKYDRLVLLLLIVLVNIVMEKYKPKVLPIIITAALVVVGINLEGFFAVLLCLPVFDLTFRKLYIGSALLGLYTIYSAVTLSAPYIIPFVMISAALAYVLENASARQSASISSLDSERQLRYELEQVKDKLLDSSKEIARLAEIRERNRIARGIHDNVGHAIAGILIQLQLARKLWDSDPKKSAEILDKSILGLSDSLTILRDTVHNIKPDEELGVEYIKNIIANFSFCAVEFSFTGDFALLSPRHMEIMGASIKEALTNASKYSGAQKVVITVEINERYVRLYIKDNGKGCKNIKEGLGLSGMRDRVQNMGGTFSVSPSDGFLIVCILPINQREGDGLVEGFNS